MASFGVTILISLSVVAGFFQESAAIVGGTTRDPCDFPGLAVVVVENQQLVFCHGVIVGQQLQVPEICYMILLRQATSSRILINYGNGNGEYIIPVNGLRGNLQNGVYHVELPGIPQTGVCVASATIFDPATHTLIPSTCQLVSFGSSTPTATFFAGIVQGTSVTKSSSSGCCSLILPTMTVEEIGPYGDTSNKNCFDAQGSPCGVADLGAPIYCDTTSDEQVVIALASSIPCNKDSAFTGVDLSNGSDNAKFGYSL